MAKTVKIPSSAKGAATKAAPVKNTNAPSGFAKGDSPTFVQQSGNAQERSEPARAASGSYSSTGLPSGAAAPFLTPAQQEAFTKALTTDSNDVTTYSNDLNSYISNANATLAKDQHTNAVDTDNANQSLAARGMFQSSIRDGDLNDLDLTLTQQTNTLNTGIATATTKYNTLIGQAGTNDAATTQEYNGLAVQNAEGVTPVVGGASSVVPSTSNVPTATATVPNTSTTTTTGGVSGTGQPVTAAAATPKVTVQPSAAPLAKMNASVKPFTPKIPKVNQNGPRPTGISGGSSGGTTSVGAPK